MTAISKSIFIKAEDCLRSIWLGAYAQEEATKTNTQKAQEGITIGKIAQNYFGRSVVVPIGSREVMAQVTRELIEAGEPVICEATFLMEDLVCRVDLLVVEPEGVRIVEVKSASNVDEKHVHDASFQAWLVEQCGYRVLDISIMHVNKNYVRHGDIDPKGLLVCEKINRVSSEEIEDTVEAIRQTLKKSEAPEFKIVSTCKTCEFKGYCWRSIPHPSVFDIGDIQIATAMKKKEQGILSFEDAYVNLDKFTPKQQVQICATVENSPHVEAEQIRNFLDTLHQPLYFLDFETARSAIPYFDGVRPYEQVPTQYSLHILENGQLDHRECLVEHDDPDPKRTIAERLCVDIPAGSTVVAYHSSFEEGRIREMSEHCSDLAEHLESWFLFEKKKGTYGLCDLEIPFSERWYYVPAMRGKSTIKCVLPALYPDDPDLDYSVLEGVHSGTEAIEAFLSLSGMDPEDRERTRKQLLEYCKLDTLAMVRLYEKLVEVAQLS